MTCRCTLSVGSGKMVALRARRIARRSWLSMGLLAGSALLMAASAAAQTITCSSSSHCPSSAPCCSKDNQCGSGAMYCGGGCNPLLSNSPSSCNPNPICQTQNITLTPSDYNNTNMFMPILSDNGTASTPFVLDYGTLGAGSEGVVLQLTERTQGMFSTSQYMLYGDVEATIRHDARAGVVAAFIFMSDVKDEIDWEFTTANPQDTQTNTFALGITATRQPETLNQTGSFSVSDWHTYGVNWQPDYIQWKIDGNVVRTLYANNTNGNFPQTPSRIQLSIWAGGDSSNPQGVIQWAGGPIDWNSPTYKSQGYYAHEIKNIFIGCAPQNTGNIATVGNGTSPTSYIYTGNNFTGTDRPEFKMSTNPIPAISNPSAGGQPGMPGYAGSQTSQVTNGNSWDGSGSSMSNTVRQQSGASTSGGSGSGSAFNSQAALKYGVPIAASVIGAILLWAAALACWRRQRNRKLKSMSTSGIAGGSLGPPGTALGATGKAGKYAAIPKGDDYAEDDYTPLGAERKGQGYGPAVGPTPGPAPYRNVSRTSDNTSASQHKFDASPRQSDDSYAMGDIYAQPYQQRRPPQQQPQQQQPWRPSPAQAYAVPQYQYAPRQQQQQPSYGHQQQPSYGHQQYASYQSPMPQQQQPQHRQGPSQYSQHSYQSSMGSGYSGQYQAQAPAAPHHYYG